MTIFVICWMVPRHLQHYVLMTLNEAVECIAVLEKQLAFMFKTIVEETFTGERPCELKPNVVQQSVESSLHHIKVLCKYLEEGRLVDADRVLAYLNGNFASEKQLRRILQELDGEEVPRNNLNDDLNILCSRFRNLLQQARYNVEALKFSGGIFHHRIS